MKNRKQTANEDIVQQHYKGASPVATALGEGAIQTKFLAIGGLIAGGVATWIFHDKAKPFIENITTTLEKGTQSKNLLVQGASGLGHWFMEIPKGLVSFARKIPAIDKFANNYTQAPAITEGAIMTSTAAGIVGSLTGGTVGYRHARAGKQQFEDAKSEISTLRAKLIDTQAELEDAKTVHAARKGHLKVAGDEPPAIDRPSATISQAQHQGMAHAHTQEAQRS